jgi:hypothetical protein
MRAAGFVGVGLGWWLEARMPRMRDIRIDLLIQGHNTADGPLRQVGTSQETPDAELAGIRMPLLEVIDGDYHGEPLLAGGLGAGFVVLQPSHVVRLEARDPSIDGRTRHP